VRTSFLVPSLASLSDKELSSWKEIASYLGVGVRTAQIWERERGLPVHRLPGPRGQVRARVSELEEWKRSGELNRHTKEDSPTKTHETPSPTEEARTFTENVTNSAGVANPALANEGASLLPARQGSVSETGNSARLPHTRRRSGVWLLAVAIVVPLLLSAGWLLWPVQRPSLWRVEGSTLIISEANGQEAWRHTFTEPITPEMYTLRYNEARRKILLTDLNGDGANEVLFALMPAKTGAFCAKLLCFSNTGRLLWEFQVGKAVRSATRSFEQVFGINQFGITTVEGKPHILVASKHYLYFPVQVALLDTSGRPVREYWHSGDFTQLLIEDLDGDGREEAYLGGVSNAHRAATIVVLDPASMTGASREPDPAFQLQGFAPGKALRRLLLGRTCINEKDALYNVVHEFNLTPEAFIVDVHEKFNPYTLSSFLHFDQKLRLQRVEVSSQLVGEHEQMERDRRVAHPLAQDLAQLRSIKEISY
jgi:excisionase family DNA binding protein